MKRLRFVRAGACLFPAVLVALVTGCTSTPTVHPRKDLLGFLVDGHSSCLDVIVHLGDPSQQYEQGRLLTYRIFRDDNARDAIVVSRTWEQANYSLVVHCDGNGEVLAHALVAVKAGH